MSSGKPWPRDRAWSGSIHDGMASSIGKLIVDRDTEHVRDDGEAWAHHAIKGKLRQACHSLLLIPQHP